MVNRQDTRRGDYLVDLFDPNTWYKGVFGVGAVPADCGIGGDSGMSPHPIERESEAERRFGRRRDFTGLGPRGYRRSDARIQDELCARLANDGEVDASDVEVSVVDGVVTLSGQIGSKSEKYLAEDVALSVKGVRDVKNRISVKRKFWQPFPGYHWI